MDLLRDCMELVGKCLLKWKGGDVSDVVLVGGKFIFIVSYSLVLLLLSLLSSCFHIQALCLDSVLGYLSKSCEKLWYE